MHPGSDIDLATFLESDLRTEFCDADLVRRAQQAALRIGPPLTAEQVLDVWLSGSAIAVARFLSMAAQS